MIVKYKALIDHLTKKNIETRLSFTVHIQPYHKQRFDFKENDFLQAMKCYKTFIDIPIWADIGDLKQDFIINEIKSFFI